MTVIPPGDRPAGSRIVAKYLLPVENVQIVKRRHWAVLAGPISLAGGGLIIAMALDTGMPAVPFVRDIIWLGWALVLSYLIWQLIEWWYDRFIVTDRRIMYVTGIVTRKVAMMPLVKVTDMSYKRSVLARMLGYGEFIMESAGQEQALRNVTFVPQPDWLYREICALLFVPEQAVVPPAPPSHRPPGPTLQPAAGPPGPSDSDESPRWGSGYGPSEDTDVDIRRDEQHLGGDEDTAEHPSAKSSGSTPVPY